MTTALAIRINLARLGLMTHRGPLTPSTQREAFGGFIFGDRYLAITSSGVRVTLPSGERGLVSFTEVAQWVNAQPPEAPLSTPRWMRRLQEAP